jgi:site-specific DNA-methyltransferase (cytosine-N4-specific)
MAVEAWFEALRAAGELATAQGAIARGDAREVLREHVPDASVDLILSSPPFGMIDPGEDEAERSHAYREWFRPLGEQFRRVLKDSGSLVLELGGVWLPAQPTRGLYHFELLVMLCRELGFHLAQEFYSFNPRHRGRRSRWADVEHVRVRDCVHCLWWLSRTPWPKANTRRVNRRSAPDLRPAATAAQAAGPPAGRALPNLLAVPPAEASPGYLAYCAEHGLPPHPARFPAELPEYFIRLLSEPGDLVLDPFAGSCVTGEVAQRLGRRWLCIELDGEYLQGAVGRFTAAQSAS